MSIEDMISVKSDGAFKKSEMRKWADGEEGDWRDDASAPYEVLSDIDRARGILDACNTLCKAYYEDGGAQFKALMDELTHGTLKEDVDAVNRAAAKIREDLLDLAYRA